LKKLVICALALGGFAASAQAADLDVGSLKDPLPETLTYKGITIYGVIDVGYGYQDHGLTTSGLVGQQYSMWGSPKSLFSNSTVNNNALSQSTIGVKIEEAIGYGFTAIGRIETGFNPISGELPDACGSVVRAAGFTGTNAALAPANGDGSRCGQALNGEVYGGVSSSSYGTLKLGRQNTLEFDALAAYDPMSLAPSMSPFGWSGSLGGGIGATETARWDDALKYTYQYGPVHAGVAYTAGGQDQSLHGPSASADIGATWRGLSVDAIYTHETKAIQATSGVAFTGNQLNYNVADSTNWSVLAKYTFDFGGGFKDDACGGFKDSPVACGKFTVYGGYTHSDMVDGGGVPVGSTTIGGYILKNLNTTYTGTRELATAFVGGKYEIGPWAFTGAYYHTEQSGTWGMAAFGAAGACNGHNNSYVCPGNLNTESFLVDYNFNKHFDIYAGVMFSQIDGGLAHSFASPGTPFFNTSGDETSVVTGMRLKF
jgi:predicted porin